MSDFVRIREEFEQALLLVNRVSALNVMRKAIGTSPAIEVVEQVVVPVMEKIGAGWERGSIALSQIYMSGRICEELVDGILPPGSPVRGKDQPKMAIAVLEDYHMLGKRIVYSSLRAGGFELQNFGRTEVDDLVGRVKREGIEVLLISTLMLRSALLVKQVKAKLVESGSDVKVVVGGAPFRLDDQLWKDVGADGTGRTASEALTIVSEVIGGIGWPSLK